VMFLCLLLLGASAETYQNYGTINLNAAGNTSGHGDWVAYDADTNTVWLSHQPDQNVVVLDADDDRIRVTIPKVVSGNGITFSDSYAFVADYGSETTNVYDKRNYYLVQTLSTPGGPDAVYWDFNHRVLWITLDDASTIIAFNQTSNHHHDDDENHQNQSSCQGPLHREPFQATPSTTLSLETTVNVSQGPDVGVFVGDFNHIYQPIDNEINVIDTNTRTIIANWPLPFTGVAKGVSYDPKTHALLVGTGSEKAFFVSAINGSVLATITLPGAVDESVMAPHQRRAFMGDKAGYVDVIDLDSRQLIQEVPTHTGAHTLTVKATNECIKLWSYLDQINQVDLFRAQL